MEWDERDHRPLEERWWSSSGKWTTSKQFQPDFQQVWLQLPHPAPLSNHSRTQTRRQFTRKAWARFTSWGSSGPSVSATGCSRCFISLLLRAPSSLLWCPGVWASKQRMQTDWINSERRQGLLLALSLSPWRRWRKTDVGKTADNHGQCLSPLHISLSIYWDILDVDIFRYHLTQQ